MKTWKEFTSELTEDQLLTIISDYKEFEKEGVIGTCFLRNKANEWLQNVKAPIGVIFIMNDLGNYAFRHFAELWLEGM